MNLKFALETRPNPYPFPESSLLEPDPLYIGLRHEQRPARDRLAVELPPKPHNA